MARESQCAGLRRWGIGVMCREFWGASRRAQAVARRRASSGREPSAVRKSQSPSGSGTGGMSPVSAVSKGVASPTPSPLPPRPADDAAKEAAARPGAGRVPRQGRTRRGPGRGKSCGKETLRDVAKDRGRAGGADLIADNTPSCGRHATTGRCRLGIDPLRCPPRLRARTGLMRDAPDIGFGRIRKDQRAAFRVRPRRGAVCQNMAEFHPFAGSRGQVVRRSADVSDK